MRTLGNIKKNKEISPFPPKPKRKKPKPSSAFSLAAWNFLFPKRFITIFNLD
jgi:hypothetical protein